MRNALLFIATYLSQNDIHLDLVAVGQTRAVLRQPDQAENDLVPLDTDNGEIQLLHNFHPAEMTYLLIGEAIAFAHMETGINLEGPWINHKYKYHHEEMDRQLPTRSLTEPRTQEVIIFGGVGLTVFDGSLRVN